jgi:mediator of replication checkpoint protein 1
VEDQAVESDEDDMLGFGGVRKEQDEDEDEDDLEHDADGVVKNLVDDAHMDETALAKVKVLEKHLWASPFSSFLNAISTLNQYYVCYSEHQDADDARLEKEVQDVVAGKKRTGRRRGAGGLLGSDGSDESEDDEEARALRQRLAKKRRVEGDTLDELARNPATASFHAMYQMALVDDAEEFAHLDRDEDVELEAELDRGQDEGGEEEGGDDGQDREEGSEDRRGEGEDEDEDVEMAEPSKTEKEEISAAEVRKALQQVARGERVRLLRTLIITY